MAILAHRGITATARDNSHAAIEAVAEASRAGTPVGLELDVRRTLDDLVMNHNASDWSTVLARRDLSQLAGLCRERDLVTLAVALDLMVDVEVINLELKEPESVEPVIETVRRHCATTGKSLSCFVLSSFVPWTLKRIKEVAPEIATGALVDRALLGPEDEEAVLEHLGRDRPLSRTGWFNLQVLDYTDADFLHAHWSSASHALLDEVASRGKRTSFWTVNDERLMTELALDHRVAHVVTDFPHRIFPELRPRGGHRKETVPAVLS